MRAHLAALAIVVATAAIAAQPRVANNTLTAVPGIAVGVAASLALVIVTSRGESSIVDRSASPTTAPAPVATPIPLELLALRHERDRDRITIRGVVRNPPGGANIDELTAVTSLFDREGGLVGNGGSTIDLSTLRPGTESGFVVSVGNAATVGRYRVSFRTGNRIVPHVDRRSLNPISRTAR